MRSNQERDSQTWEIVELFYRATIEFGQIFDNYEWRVLQHSYQKGLHRLDLRLEPEDLAGLMDFKALERLRDEYIFRLKETCHKIFRGRHRTDLLDIYVSDVFHEISILKEEHYNLKTYAPQYARDSREVELSYIVEESHSLFPSKINHIRYLFGKAKERMEELLPGFRSNRILIRSLYLNRDDFVRLAYENGIDDFYRFLYPDVGPLEGYYEVGKSFHASGFQARALEALQFAERSAEQFEGKRPPRVRKIETDVKRLLEALLGAQERSRAAARAESDRENGDGADGADPLQLSELGVDGSRDD